MKISIFQRIIKIYFTIGKTFGKWISPIITGLFISILRPIVGTCRILDKLFFPAAFQSNLKNPIVIVGNPRSGTTFLHRYLVRNGIGVGSQLWQMLYPSILLQKILKPLLPFLEKVSPSRYHSTVAHKTSLQSVETDDVALFFRYLDGFFLYGFILSWTDEDLFNWVDPKIRNTSNRDYKWLESIWLRNQYIANHNRTVGKLFSLSVNLPEFLTRFPDSKILYIIRDPLSVIPSGLSLVTGVLDKKFGFWSQPKNKRNHFINKLYNGLVQLLLRFHSDWTNEKFDKSRVMLVPFDRMMSDFDLLMIEIIDFIDHPLSDILKKDIQKTAESQCNFKSDHKYDLAKFGLSEKQIINDCKPIYDTFLN
jgi:hypothetical protein